MMNKQKKDRNNLLALTGAAAVFAIAVNVGITVINSQRRNRKRKDLRGSNVRVNLSAPEILKLADRVIAKSKQVHDAVASVPFDKVSYKNVILPLADLEAQQFPLVQSCIFPKMVTTSEDVRKASAEAERRIDAHDLCCRDVDLTEKLDYSSAVAALGFSLVVALLRAFNVRSEASRVMVSAPLIAFVTTHILYLNFFQLDYTNCSQIYRRQGNLLRLPGESRSPIVIVLEPSPSVKFASTKRARSF